MAEIKEFLGTGRRKTAVARVRMASGSGKIVVNGRPFENYFPTDTLRTLAIMALAATESATKYDIRVKVEGGGPTGQAGAVRHGIARALLKVDAALRPVLKTAGLLTRDPRMREREKYGQPGARKRFQYSKR
jgi:small subunit ribosomal protein S9